MAQAITQVMIHTRILKSNRRMTHAFNFPVLKVSAYNLRVASHNEEWHPSLPSVEFSDEIQQPLADADALVIR